MPSGGKYTRFFAADAARQLFLHPFRTILLSSSVLAMGHSTKLTGYRAAVHWNGIGAPLNSSGRECCEEQHRWMDWTTPSPRNE